ncbi:MAG: YncE family protein, partial [Bacteroidota bacterium]
NPFSDEPPYASDDQHPTVSREDLDKLRNWIDQGGKDKDGKYAWTQQELSPDNKIFNLCAGSDLVAVSELRSNRIMRYFSVGRDPDNLEAPHYIALSPDKQFLYVSLIEGGLIEKYRTDNYDFVERLEVGANPALLTLSRDGRYAVVSHFNADDNSPKLTMFETETMTIVGVPLIASGNFLHRPHGLVLNADATQLYVGANNGNYYSKLRLDVNDGNGPFVDEEKIPLDPSNSPVPMGSVSYQPYALLIDDSNNRLFISCNTTDEVRVFDLSNDQLIGSIPTADYPRLMDYDPVGQRLFVICRDEVNQAAQGDWLGALSVLNTNDLSLIKNVYGVGHVPHGVAFSASNSSIIVNSENIAGLIPSTNPTLGRPGPPGQYVKVDAFSLLVVEGTERQMAVLPNACVVTE